MKVSIFWFRRDLRLEDNNALYSAITQNKNILPIFIFDESILDELEKDDPRINFIYNTLSKINQQLQKHHSSIKILKGKTEAIWKSLVEKYAIDTVFINKDYEPYAIKRDQKIAQLLSKNAIKLLTFKDQVIHEESEVMKADGTPYTVFTPYKNKWLSVYTSKEIKPKIAFENFYKKTFAFPTLQALGFSESKITVQEYNLNNLSNYGESRNYPALDSTSYLGPHLRFGTISIRQIIGKLNTSNAVFLSELIWREFLCRSYFIFQM